MLFTRGTINSYYASLVAHDMAQPIGAARQHLTEGVPIHENTLPAAAGGSTLSCPTLNFLQQGGIHIAGKITPENHCPVHENGQTTAQALQAALKKYLQHRAKGPKLHHGKQSLKQLKAHGEALTNIEVTEANIGAFKPCAKKYGVDFALRKDKTTQPPHYIVIFKAKDADNLEQAFREFTAKTLTKEQRPSIRKVLAAARQKAAQQPKRAKEKIKQRGLER